MRPGFMLYVVIDSSEGMDLLAKALAFAKIVNDGDEEGAFVMHRLPTAEEAGLIRRYCAFQRRGQRVRA